jgi:hypothetical protein
LPRASFGFHCPERENAARQELHLDSIVQSVRMLLAKSFIWILLFGSRIAPPAVGILFQF